MGHQIGLDRQRIPIGGPVREPAHGLRMGRRALLGGLAGLWLAGCRATPAYTLITDRPGNHAAVTADQAGITVRIESHGGIGRLDFAWWTVAPPPLTAIVLALAGLEQVTLHWHGRTVSTGWSGSAAAWATLSTGSQAAISLSPGDADWPSVSQPHDKLFVLVPPSSFNAAAPINWQVAWIDFYR